MGNEIEIEVVTMYKGIDGNLYATEIEARKSIESGKACLDLQTFIDDRIPADTIDHSEDFTSFLIEHSEELEILLHKINKIGIVG